MRLAIILIALLAASPTLGQVQQFYNSNGDYAGTIMPSGPNAKQFYDASGNYAGTALRAGRNVMFYDGNGNYAGTMMNSGPMQGDE